MPDYEPGTTIVRRFLCPVEVERGPGGTSLVFVVTLRNGSVKRFPGPEGVTAVEDIDVYQPRGEDEVTFTFLARQEESPTDRPPHTDSA